MSPTNASPRHAVPHRLRHIWPAFLILLAGIVLTLAAGKFARDQVQSRQQSIFDEQNAAAVSKITASIDEKRLILNNMLALYDGNVQVVRDVFELFATVPVRTIESITAIGYAPRIQSSELANYHAYARNQGLEYLNFAVTPVSDREEHFPLEYLVPLSENRTQLGFDLATDSLRRHAVQEARRQGQTVATSMHTLADGTKGFSLFAPVWRPGAPTHTEAERVKACTGVVMLNINSEVFIRNAVSRLTDTTLVALSVYDGEVADPANVLYTDTAPDDPLIEQSIPLHFANHTWTVVSKAKPALREVASTNFPTWVLLGGFITTLLLFGFVYSLLNSRKQAQVIAERITRSQRRIVDSSLDLIGTMNIDGVWQSMNPACKNILGYTPEQIIGKAQIDLVLSSDRPRFAKALEQAADETPLLISVRQPSTLGVLRWIDWSFTVSRTDGLIYCIGRDGTEQISAEQEIVRKNVQLDLAAMITDRENVRKQRSIREQNIRTRMQLTTVMGFLQLILGDRSAEKEEIIDYVETANEAAEGLLTDLREMTEVELHKMEDMVFEISLNSSQDVINRLVDDIEAFGKGEQLPLRKEIGTIPEHAIKIGVSKLLEANRLILALLRPHFGPDTSLAVESLLYEKEGWLIANLHFRSMVNLPDTSDWIPTFSREDIVHLEKEELFARALIRPMLEVMDAGIEITHDPAHDGCTVSFRFLL